MTFEDQDQFLDQEENQEEPQEDDGFFESEDETDQEEDPPKKGNLAKALQEERQRRRETEARLKEIETQNQRTNALLERLGQGQQQLQYDQQAYRDQIQQFMLERPEEYTRWVQEQAYNQFMQAQAPSTVAQAKMLLTTHPEYSELYKLPQVRAGIDTYMESEVSNGRPVNTQNVLDAMKLFSDIYHAGRGGGSASKDPAKDRLSSVVGKGKGNRSATIAADDDIMKYKNDPKKFLEAIKSPKGKAIISAELKGQL